MTWREEKDGQNGRRFAKVVLFIGVRHECGGDLVYGRKEGWKCGSRVGGKVKEKAQSHVAQHANEIGMSAIQNERHGGVAKPVHVEGGLHDGGKNHRRHNCVPLCFFVSTL